MNRSRLLADLLTLIGESGTLALIHAHAGKRVYIPSIFTHDSWLSKLIGEDRCRSLTSRYGGEHVHIPNNAQAKAEWMQQELAKAIRAGTKPREAAKQHGVTIRYAQMIAKRTA